IPQSLAFDSQDRILYALFAKNDPENCHTTGISLMGIDTLTNKFVSDTHQFFTVSGMTYVSKGNLLLIEGSNKSAIPSILVLDASNAKQVSTINLPPYVTSNVFFGPILYNPVNGLIYFEWGAPGASNLIYEGSVANASSKSIVGSFNASSSDMPPSKLTLDQNSGLVYLAESGNGGCAGVNHCTYYGGQNVTVIKDTQTIGSYRVSSNINSSLGSVADDFTGSSGSVIFVANSTENPPFFGNYAPFHHVSVINTTSGEVMQVLNFQQTVTYLYVDLAAPSGSSWLYVATLAAVYVVEVS
ncbi:MAG: hypothetical protein ACREBS_03950, partial [Nitrososphaerales archaeon]